MSFVVETSKSNSFVYSAILSLLFLVLAKMQAELPRGGVGWGLKACLLSQYPVYPPLTTPFFDLLTAADGRDRGLEL